eukprot:4145330-Prymnesium_polylepis.2
MGAGVRGSRDALFHASIPPVRQPPPTAFQRSWRPRVFSTMHSEYWKTAPTTARFLPHERLCVPISRKPLRNCSFIGRCSLSMPTPELNGARTAPSPAPKTPPATPLMAVCMVQLSRAAWPGSAGGFQMNSGSTGSMGRRRASSLGGARSSVLWVGAQQSPPAACQLALTLLTQCGCCAPAWCSSRRRCARPRRPPRRRSTRRASRRCCARSTLSACPTSTTASTASSAPSCGAPATAAPLASLTLLWNCHVRYTWDIDNQVLCPGVDGKCEKEEL